MDGMAMSGHWAMSTTWGRTPGQTWTGAAISFAVMWILMMAAMMLPLLVPILLGYRDAISRMRELRVGHLTALVALGYLLVWAALGAVIFPLGTMLAAAQRRSPIVARISPLAGALVVLLAGALQFTAWKTHHLGGWREILRLHCASSAHSCSALRIGVRLGIHCVICCAGATSVLLVLGVMDPRVMAAVTVAVIAERLAPAGERVARISGAVAVVVGVLLIGRALGTV